MGTYLLAATPILGHVGPLLRIAERLVAQGHTVTLLTGARFRDAVERAGAAFAALPGRADFDDRDPDSAIPDRERYRGIRRARYEIESLFIATIPDQARAVDALVDSIRPDAVLTDNVFAGLVAFMRRHPRRPPVLALGVTPLSQAEPGLAPYGLGLPPARTAGERARYRVMAAVASGILFRGVQRAGARVFAELGLRLDFPVMDASREFDLLLQTGPRGLDYPRPHLSANVRYVGVIPPARSDADLPPWWDELDGGRPIVHVTQGTIDNLDFDHLVRPTLAALADRDVLVVVSTGGRPVAELGPLPANARAASFLPYDALLPRLSAMVSNGGFGGVQAALAQGVPLVLAGVTEDKPEVTARVAWAGAGVNLRTRTPDAAAIGDAVDDVLTDGRYRAAARRLQDEIAAQDTLTEIETHLEFAQVRAAHA